MYTTKTCQRETNFRTVSPLVVSKSFRYCRRFKFHQRRTCFADQLLLTTTTYSVIDAQRKPR